VFGGAGFIGSHFVDLALASGDFTEILVLDKLTYAGSLGNLASALSSSRVKFIAVDLRDRQSYTSLLSGVDVVVNFAAESHVDRSLLAPQLFAEVNAMGACTLASVCLEQRVGLYLYISTDEVYGPTLTGESDENSITVPTSPYSASKAAGESLVMAFWRTFGLPVIVTRGCNTYGPRQFPEKLIPLAIRNFLTNTPVPMYGSGNQIREWIYVTDHANAILRLIHAGVPGEIYNIGSGVRLENRTLLRSIAKTLDANPELISSVEDRLGHDFRYAIDSMKLRRHTGWVCEYSMEEALTLCRSW